MRATSKVFGQTRGRRCKYQNTCRLESKEKAAELSKPAVYLPTPLTVDIIGGVLWDDDISGQNETNEACQENLEI